MLAGLKTNFLQISCLDEPASQQLELRKFFFGGGGGVGRIKCELRYSDSNCQQEGLPKFIRGVWP